MSQKTLYKLETFDSILSKSNVIRLESGKKDPKSSDLFKILDALDVTLEELEQYLGGGDKVLFDNDFAILWEHGFSNRMDEFENELNELRQKSYCNQNIPTTKQAILLCDSVLLSAKYSNHNASLNALYDALQITRPDLLTKTNKVRDSKVSSSTLRMNEYRILRQITVILKKLSKNSNAYNIEKSIISSLKNPNLASSIRNKILPVTYYNFSHSLIANKQYDNAISLIETALAFCDKVREYKMKGDLIYVAAKANYLLGNIKVATELFASSYNAHNALGNHGDAEEVAKNASKLYHIVIN